MRKPFVSVLIGTYNHEWFIEHTIVSVLERDFPASDREIIAVDDGSTDRTQEIVRKKNGGQASAFNAGIPECKGEIVAFLDGDDWWRASGHGHFNLRGEAIVHTPTDATRTFFSSGTDALIIGSFLVEK